MKPGEPGTIIKVRTVPRCRTAFPLRRRANPAISSDDPCATVFGEAPARDAGRPLWRFPDDG